MPTTSRGYRYPAPSNAPNVPQDFANLAADINTDLTSLLTIASSAVVLGGAYTAGRNVLQRMSGWAMMSLNFQRPGAAIPAGVGSSIGTVPSGYRPSVTIDVPGVTLAGGTVTMSLESTGNVLVRPAASVAAGVSVVIFAPWPIAS